MRLKDIYFNQLEQARKEKQMIEQKKRVKQEYHEKMYFKPSKGTTAM